MAETVSGVADGQCHIVTTMNMSLMWRDDYGTYVNLTSYLLTNDQLTEGML